MRSICEKSMENTDVDHSRLEINSPSFSRLVKHPKTLCLTGDQYSVPGKITQLVLEQFSLIFAPKE